MIKYDIQMAFKYKQSNKWIQRCARLSSFKRSILRQNAQLHKMHQRLKSGRERKREKKISRFSRHSNIYSTAVTTANRLEKFINYKIPFVYILKKLSFLSLFLSLSFSIRSAHNAIISFFSSSIKWNCVQNYIGKCIIWLERYDFKR